MGTKPCKENKHLNLGSLHVVALVLSPFQWVDVGCLLGFGEPKHGMYKINQAGFFSGVVIYRAHKLEVIWCFGGLIWVYIF